MANEVITFSGGEAKPSRHPRRNKRKARMSKHPPPAIKQRLRLRSPHSWRLSQPETLLSLQRSCRRRRGRPRRSRNQESFALRWREDSERRIPRADPITQRASNPLSRSVLHSSRRRFAARAQPHGNPGRLRGARKYWTLIRREARGVSLGKGVALRCRYAVLRIATALRLSEKLLGILGDFRP
jgi:hypothetical protein